MSNKMKTIIVIILAASMIIPAIIAMIVTISAA